MRQTDSTYHDDDGGDVSKYLEGFVNRRSKRQKVKLQKQRVKELEKILETKRLVRDDDDECS